MSGCPKCGGVLVEIFDESINDSFINDFKNIKNIKILKKTNGNKDIIIKNQNDELIIITINKENKIIKYINFPILEKVGYNFMSGNEELETIYFPKLKIIGSSFIFSNKKIKKVNLDS